MRSGGRGEQARRWGGTGYRACVPIPQGHGTRGLTVSAKFGTMHKRGESVIARVDDWSRAQSAKTRERKGVGRMRKQAKYIVSAAGVACPLALLVVRVWPQEAAPKLSPETQARVSSLEVAFHAAVATPAETARLGMALAAKECGPQLEQVVTSARRSPEATAKLRAHLEAALRTCADRYAPGKGQSADELDPAPQTEDPARNVGLHAYLLLKLAAAEGPQGVREAIGVFGDTLASVSCWGEERFRYLYPDRTAALDREKRDLGGDATSTAPWNGHAGWLRRSLRNRNSPTPGPPGRVAPLAAGPGAAPGR